MLCPGVASAPGTPPHPIVWDAVAMTLTPRQTHWRGNRGYDRPLDVSQLSGRAKCCQENSVLLLAHGPVPSLNPELANPIHLGYSIEAHMIPPHRRTQKSDPKSSRKNKPGPHFATQRGVHGPAEAALRGHLQKYDMSGLYQNQGLCFNSVPGES